MAKFCPLFSSSKGNSTYFSAAGTSVLIDVGVSFRQLDNALSGHGLELSKIQALLITHEHSDHIRGLNVFLKKTNIPVYAPAKTLDYLATAGLFPHGAAVAPIDGPTALGNLEVLPFETPHDANYSVGYQFSLPDSRKVVFATDLGHITPTVRQHLTGCDLVMLESNYDRGMLDCSRYPYPLKQRIKGNYGHLSNDDCAMEIADLVRKGGTRFVLGHLSEQNNLPQLAFEVTKSLLEIAGMRENQDYILKIAAPRGTQPAIVF